MKNQNRENAKEEEDEESDDDRCACKILLQYISVYHLVGKTQVFSRTIRIDRDCQDIPKPSDKFRAYM